MAIAKVVTLAASGGAAIDTAIVGELIALCKSCMGLFTEFPLNVLLIGGLVFIGFGIFKAAKRAAR